MHDEQQLAHPVRVARAGLYHSRGPRDRRGAVLAALPQPALHSAQPSSALVNCEGPGPPEGREVATTRRNRPKLMSRSGAPWASVVGMGDGDGPERIACC